MFSLVGIDLPLQMGISNQGRKEEVHQFRYRILSLVYSNAKDLDLRSDSRLAERRETDCVWVYSEPKPHYSTAFSKDDNNSDSSAENCV
jgi:hypothetical protein